MLDQKTRLVAAREVVENTRTKAFWIGIFIFPLLLVMSIVVPAWIEKTKSAREYVVVDHSGWLHEAIEQRAALPDLEKVFRHALTLKQQSGEAGAEESVSWEALPAELRQAVTQLELAIPMLQARLEADEGSVEPDAAETQAVESFAATISGLSGPRGERLRGRVPEAAMAELTSLRDAVRDWWQALPAEEAAGFGGAVTKDRYVVRRPGPSETPAAQAPPSIEALNDQVAAEDLFAYFVIDEDPVHAEKAIKYVSANLTDEDLKNWFGNLASEVIRDRRLDLEGIDPEVASWVQAPVEFEVTRIGAAGEEAVDTQARVRQWAPVAFVYLLWIAIFSIAQMLLTNTVEEKSNRIMEVLLSSVSPLQLMVGKIGGIAVTGMLMVGSWVIFFYLAVQGLPLLLDADIPVDLSAIATDGFFLLSFVLYFLLGYLFYAALLVAVGSVCNSLKEAQNLQAPIMMLLMVPLFSMVPIAQDPNGALAKLLSFVPPFTPFVMMNRAAGPPQPWEYAATTALLLVSLLLVMWAAAKVFRVGILMTGKPPKLREILRWIRVPVGAVPQRK
ncbi:MAG: ABC transporter permease [Acidobacteriota bacterium]